MIKQKTNAESRENYSPIPHNAPIAIPCRGKIGHDTGLARKQTKDERELEEFFVGSPVSEERKKLTKYILQQITPILGAQPSPEDSEVYSGSQDDDCEWFL